MTANTNNRVDESRTIKLGIPIASLLLLLAVLTGGLLLFAVNGQDRVAREASETIARAAFNAQSDALENFIQDWSWWNESVEKLIFDFDATWVKNNLDWLPENYGVSRVFVFGPGREPVYATLNTAPVETGSAAWRNRGLLDLIAIAESKPDESGESASTYIEFADGVHLVAASKLLQEADTTGHPPYPEKGLLVVTKKIDGELLEEIEASFQLAGLELRTDRQAQSSSAILPLPGPDGHAAARVTWTPPQPGTRLFEWLFVPLGVAFVLVGGTIGLIVIRARRAGLALQQAFEARVAAQKELQYSAHHDSLTDLPNRALFLEHLTSAIAQADRYGSSFTLHYLDLDGFKEVNDTFGHPAGDDLLRELATRLTTIVRAADTAARFGGDEFAVLQRSTSDRKSASLLAERMVSAVGQPFEIGGATVHVTLSVGIAFDSEGEDPEEIIRKADRALYRAKQQGGNRYELYDAALDRDGIQRTSNPSRRPSVVSSEG